jgi:hypothetical protein
MYIGRENKISVNMKKVVVVWMAAIMIVIGSGCTKTVTNGPGRLIVNITDAPFPFSSIESATVKITKIELRKSGDGICDSLYPYIDVLSDTINVDLVDLRNGLVQKLADLQVPQGGYDLVRIYVDEAGLKVKDGDNFDVKVPSGKQTGIKVFIQPQLIVEGGLTSEVLLDFDLSRSFVLRGNLDRPQSINGFIFKPVIRAVNNTSTGTLSGIVTDTANVKIKEANVWVKQDTVVAATVCDTLGYYAIPGLNAGTFSVFAANDGFDTVQIDDVVIYAGNRTTLNIILHAK